MRFFSVFLLFLFLSFSFLFCSSFVSSSPSVSVSVSVDHDVPEHSHRFNGAQVASADGEDAAELNTAGSTPSSSSRRAVKVGPKPARPSAPSSSGFSNPFAFRFIGNAMAAVATAQGKSGPQIGSGFLQLIDTRTNQLVDSWDAISGGFRNGLLPNGVWKVGAYSLSSQSKFRDDKGFGFKVILTPTESMGRGSFLIHPAIGQTEGCIGISRGHEVVMQFTEKFKEIARLGLPMRLDVDILNNINLKQQLPKAANLLPSVAPDQYPTLVLPKPDASNYGVFTVDIRVSNNDPIAKGTMKFTSKVLESGASYDIPFQMNRASVLAPGEYQLYIVPYSGNMVDSKSGLSRPIGPRELGTNVFYRLFQGSQRLNSILYFTGSNTVLGAHIAVNGGYAPVFMDLMGAAFRDIPLSESFNALKFTVTHREIAAPAPAPAPVPVSPPNPAPGADGQPTVVGSACKSSGGADGQCATMEACKSAGKLFYYRPECKGLNGARAVCCV